MVILDYNHCIIENCKCGWNVHISGTSEEELKQTKILLAPLVLKDLTNYADKVSTEKFLEA